MSPEVMRFAAFSEGGAGGNPAGVVLEGGALTEQAMLAVAACVGYSETAFVIDVAPPRDGHQAAGLRFFSPLAEVAFCGHATIATAIALAERSGATHLDFTTPAGPVPVVTRREGGRVVATLTSPPTSTREVDPRVLVRALRTLRLTEDQLDPGYPPHVASAGNQHLLLGVDRRDTLAGLDYDFPALATLMTLQGWTTVHLFWAEGPTTFHARDPFPPGGRVEDPATGAAAAAFGGYLRDLGLLPTGGPHRVTVRQGQDMGAPSRLLVDVDPTTRSVRVSGEATKITGLITGPTAGTDTTSAPTARERSAR